jgi:ElaB/YqjD/DUF883 family membrane-anchored ribosome-binding protein
MWGARRLKPHFLRSAIRNRAESAQEQLGSRGDEVREWAVAGMRSVEECIRDQPLRSLLVAIGIGCLLGAVWVRR